MALHGGAGQCEVGSGVAWHGSRSGWVVPGTAGRGMAWHGSRRGLARRERAWLGKAGHGKEIINQLKGKNEMQSETKNFFGGIPTDIEIRRLREYFPEKDLHYGTEITYKSISELIGCHEKTHRWSAITNRWRKVVERETNIIIGIGQPGISFKVLKEHEKVTLSNCKLKNAARSIRRSYVISSRVDTKQLTEQQLREYDHATKCAVALMRSEQLKSRVPLPII
jgi:hypothetical protein